MFRRIASFFAAAMIAAVSGTPLQAAQADAGSVSGSVTLEENGDFVSGTVILVVGAGAFALSDGQGRFRIDDVPAGEYEIVAQRDHLTAGRQTVLVEPGRTATVDFVLRLSPVREEVTVTASAGGAETALEAFNAVSTLDAFDVARESAGDLATALEHEPGIAIRGFGPGAARPIIRGFDGDRVLILEDGIRTGDLSGESGDHGVAVDAAGAERIEIVRGPATLLYGSNAVGGLINVVTPHQSYRDSLFEGTRAQLSAETGSANAQAGTNVGIQHAQDGFLYWGGGGLRYTDDYATPAGTVENSATESSNARAGVGWSRDRAFWSAGVTMNDGRYGVPFAGQFHGHHEEEAGAGGGDHRDDHHGEAAIALDWQRRALRVDAGLLGLSNRFVQGLELSFNVIDWGHNELEIEGGSENVGTTYDNRTYILRAEFDQQRAGRLSGRFGAWARIRDFEAFGVEALAPRTDLNSLAAFAYEELDLGRFRVQFGGRIDRDNYQVAERGGGHAHGDDHDDHDGGELALEAPDARDRDFAGASASLGLHADLGAGNALVANLTRSHRAPAIEELYNFGPHVGTLSFDIGNPNLDPESTVGLDLSLRHQGDRVRGDLNFFVYDIGNFIFGNRSGLELENLPVYNILQGDSRFIGFDAQGSFRLAGQSWATLGLGRVDAKLTATGEALPRIPPLRGTLKLDLPYRGLTVSPRVTFASRQDNVFREETETDGYTIFDVRASYIWARQRVAHIVSVTAANLANALYRNHTSYIKDLAPEMGRSFRANYTLRFH